MYFPQVAAHWLLQFVSNERIRLATGYHPHCVTKRREVISNLMITIFIRDMERAVELYTEKLGFVRLTEYNDGKGNYLTNPSTRQQRCLATQTA